MLTISRSKIGASDDFAQYFFLRTPSVNGNVDRGLTDLWFLSRQKFATSQKKSRRNFEKKILITFLGHDIFHF
jgi:hypothetical protein